MRELTTTTTINVQQPTAKKNRNNVFNPLAPTMKYIEHEEEEDEKEKDLLETTLFFREMRSIVVFYLMSTTVRRE